jgi:hypothetical protein
MIDINDVGDGFLFGGVVLGVIFLIWYLIFSTPVIDECHKKGGQIVRIEGKDSCMDVTALKVIK